VRSVLESAVRSFSSSDHLKNVLEGQWVSLYDEEGRELPGIRGRTGAASMTVSGYEIGVDLIEMQPGAAFGLHVHPGDHILFVVKGAGCVHIDGINHRIREGDTIFIPAEYPHGVKTVEDCKSQFQFLAFGHPHKHLEATDRMHLVDE
jgi:quercetin dioxygenase-like cupin family protein